MTINHTGIRVPAAQHTAIVAWYEAALAPLGYTKAMTFMDDLVVGFADSSGAVDWWVTSSAAVPPGVPAPEPATVGADVAAALPTHTAFAAKDRAGVEAFHQAAVAAGGKCNGKPGLRDYTPTYFAAFVLDPAGNNIEAICLAAV
ncbi:uncharacterized protein B0H64DRAFT_49845 [Chaetomium fimeti]|uniref:Glyoxalase/fosfomycin resistance/dioxygenase domain-containing protein n=1 Tax=Chaetomium fimeti TaxID=1854472 RepID=A0AAE0LMU3_9PEZI|nr:hypothetical protein B0H64DRAFT_49845 [Chaetomium fimeti]